MKDKNGLEIKAGDFVKRIGMVRYADGEKLKISKKTWLVTESDGELLLPNKAEGIEFLVVGNETEGVKAQYATVEDGAIKINVGSVPEKYRVLKDVESQNWKKGEVVSICGKVSASTLENGFLERVGNDVVHQHVLIVVDPIKSGLIANEIHNG